MIRPAFHDNPESDLFVGSGAWQPVNAGAGRRLRSLVERLQSICRDDGTLLMVRRVRRVESQNSELPVIVYLHGGGFRSGSFLSLETTAAVVDRLEAVDCEIMCVGYRLAPEHPFPAAFDDVSIVLRGVLRWGRVMLVDTARVVVDGYSAGGNLAAGAVLKLHTETRLRVRGLILETPQPGFSRRCALGLAV